MDNKGINFDEIFGKKWMANKEFSDFVQSEYFIKLLKYISNSYKNNEVFPAKKDVFRIFRETDPKNIRVVILGQDPYKSEHANGYAFANSDNTLDLSPSLKIIWDRVEQQTDTTIIDFDITLQNWVDQGVFLFNSALTVQKGMVNGHLGIWKKFTAFIINLIIDNNNGVVFCLWGNKAQNVFNDSVKENKLKFVEKLTCVHPAYSAKKNVEWECNHFNEINEIQEGQNGKEFMIDWTKRRK